MVVFVHLQLQRDNISWHDCALTSVDCILLCSSSWLTVQRLWEQTERIQWQPMGQRRDIPVAESRNCRAALGQPHWGWHSSSWLTDGLIQRNDPLKGCRHLEKGTENQHSPEVSSPFSLSTGHHLVLVRDPSPRFDKLWLCNWVEK